MIEDMAAVERIDEITAVDGVDLLAVGPSDLSRSLGVSGQPDHPRLVAARISFVPELPVINPITLD
jgi:4-hydroxy-2-oxoheptanedioate aldolase